MYPVITVGDAEDTHIQGVLLFTRFVASVLAVVLGDNLYVLI